MERRFLTLNASSAIVALVAAFIVGIGVTALFGFRLDPAKSLQEETDHQNSPPTIRTIEVSGTLSFTDTGIQLHKGDFVKIAAAGSINVCCPRYEPPAGAGTTEPGACVGLADGSIARVSNPWPLNGVPCWSLIGRIGASGSLFEVGKSTSFTARSSGHLYLGPNDNYVGDNSGSWTASVTIERANVEVPRM